jgi:hypothetical protein
MLIARGHKPLGSVAELHELRLDGKILCVHVHGFACSLGNMLQIDKSGGDLTFLERAFVLAKHAPLHPPTRSDRSPADKPLWKWISGESLVLES